MPFLFVGNHPCLDFINTQLMVNGHPVDLLVTFSDLVQWLVQIQMLTRGDATSIEKQWGGDGKGLDMIKRVRAFRAVLRGMIERIASGRPVPSDAIEAINELLRYRIGCPRLMRRKGTFEREFQVVSQEANQLLGLLAEAASDLLCTCDLSLIKKCENPPCVLFFYDTTKNHTRHWCSMSVCGNRNKVAAHYRRHRKQRVRAAS
jgi:predicted RNA-binding Zn ribbon-like protein